MIMVATDKDCVSGRTSTKIHGLHVFMHPLLKLAVGVDDTPQRFRQFHRLVRRALEAPDFSAERETLAIEVLDTLDELELDDESADAFRLEWLQNLTRTVDTPVLHELQALQYLKQAGLELPRGAWRVPLATSEGMLFLRVYKIHAGREDSERAVRLPVGTAASLDLCISTAVTALREDRLQMWDSTNCLAVLRSIAMLSVLDSERTGLRTPQARKEIFLGVYQGLWLAVSQQLASTPDAQDHEVFWDGSLQRLVALHVSGAAYVETVKATPTVVDGPPPRGSAEPAAFAATSSDAPTSALLGGQASTSSIALPAGRLQVVHGPIPVAAHKEDQEMLRAYKPLLQPQPVAAMPAHHEIETLLEALSNEFPWATNVVYELGCMMRARSLFGVRELCLAPVLIVGYPGSGKSRFVRRLAEHLKLPYMPLALGGRTDSKLLSGTSRGWAGGEPTPLLRLMLQHKSASGMVLLDEIDKVGETSSNSTPAASVLLGLLEPETAARWHDGFLQTTCNFTRLTFWATANSLKSMPAALLSRFTVLYMPEPRPEDMAVLVQGITDDIAREWRLPLGVLPLAPKSMYEGARLNARELRRLVMHFLSEWAQENLRPERLH
jgi:hypothetical protein